MTRYDIAHSASRLGQYSAKPTEGARKALCRVLGYLKHTLDFRLMGVIEEGEDEFRVYSDSDHAGDKQETKRSQSGTIVTLNGVPVHWRSARQPVTALSSAEAEIYALSETVKQAQAYLWRCEEMGITVQWPMVVLVDNKQAVSFQRATCIATKLAGVIDMRQQWIKELRNKAAVAVQYISRQYNIADLLTHCQCSGDFNRMVQYIQKGGV